MLRSRSKKKDHRLEKIFQISKPFIWAVLLIFLIIKLKFFSLIIVLLLLDYIKIYLLTYTKIMIPIDFGLLSVIIFGYIEKPYYSIYIIPFLVMNRFLNGRSEATYAIKYPLLLGISYLAYFFNNIEFALLGAILVVVRYVLEYVLELAIFSNITSTTIFRRVVHIVSAYFMYSIVKLILPYF